MRNRGRRVFILRLLFAALIIVIAAVILYEPARTNTRNILSHTSLWLIKPLHALSRTLDGWRGNFAGRLLAFRENQELRLRESALLMNKAELLLLQNENQALRTALEIEREKKGDVEYAGIVGEFSEGRDEFWIIDRGSGAGIYEGATVLSPEGVMIGIVRTVAENSSTVRLLSSPSESLTVTLLPANIDALLTGDNNGEYVLSLVPDNIEVAVGGVVVSSGRNKGIPSGIPIGSVVSVERRSAESFQGIRVKSPGSLPFVNHVIVFSARLSGGE